MVDIVSNDGFEWYYSEDRETWTLAGLSKEDAIEEGRSVYEEETFWVAEGRPEELSDDFFDAFYVIKSFDKHNEDKWLDGGFDCESSDESNRALEAALKETFTKWRNEHCPDWKTKALEIRNEERIEPEDEPDSLGG